MSRPGSVVCVLASALLLACGGGASPASGSRADAGGGSGAAAAVGGNGAGAGNSGAGRGGTGATTGGNAGEYGTIDASPGQGGDAPTVADASTDSGRDGAAAEGGTISVDASTPDSGHDSPTDAGRASAVDSGGLDASDGCASGGEAPALIQSGAPGTLLLRGTVVTPDQVFDGEVFINGDTIACVAMTCAAEPGAATSTLVETHGIIFPGLIDTHNHVLFNIFDETDWSPTATYENRSQWPSDPRYVAMVDAKQYLNAEGGSTVDLGCELDKYGELKGLIAGTTSIVGAANPMDRTCYGSLARTIDQSPSGLGADKVLTATFFPTTANADSVCAFFAAGEVDAYLVHAAEGVDSTALGEFSLLGTVTTTDGCLMDPRTAIVHGVALDDPELSTMAQSGMSLVWSPKSNIALYGAGIDYTKTANIPLAVSKAINVSLAPDWSVTGSQNLLDEIRFANLIDDTVWNNQLSSEMLVEMVTSNAARVLGLETVLGSLTPGKKADILVIAGDICAPYDSLLAATPSDVRLVLVGGVALYGDASLQTVSSASPGCEALDVCGASKFACVAQSAGAPADKLDQSYSVIKDTLDDALNAYDGLGLSPYGFAPLAPLVRCP